MALRVTGFEWDAGNQDKCQKHGVSLAAIESVFHGPLAVSPDPAHSAAEERFKAIGRTDVGRGVLIVFTRTGSRAVHPANQRSLRAPEGGRIF